MRNLKKFLEFLVEFFIQLRQRFGGSKIASKVQVLRLFVLID